jgi:C-terminal processing protease CtpA/Prc
MRYVVALLLSIASSFPMRAAAADRRVDRLAHVAKVWGTIRWVHPYIFEREIDWDAALVAAIPKIDAADTDDEYASAVSTMLDALHDPLTHVAGRTSDDGAKEPKMATGPSFEQREGDLVVVAPPSSFRTAADYQPLHDALLKAKRVVIDLRLPLADGRATWQMMRQIQDALPSRECRGPALRYVQHSGFRPQIGETSGGYSSSMIIDPGPLFAPSRNAVRKRVAFLVNEQSTIMPIVPALESSGDGVVVADGPITEAPIDRMQIELPIGEGWRVEIRTGELVEEGALRVDAHVPKARSGGDDPAMRMALALLERARVPRSQPASISKSWRFDVDRSYDATNYPDVEHRLLSLFRVWAAIHFFYPYQHLMERNWDDVLVEFIPKLEAARDAQAYALAMAELVTWIPDGHTTIFGAPELTKWFGEEEPPIVARIIEGRPVVTRLTDEKGVPGVAIGDVIVRVDGEDAMARLARYERYIAGSNPWHRAYRALSRFLGGPKGSVAVLTLKDGSGRLKEARVPRVPWRSSHERSGDTVRILAGGIGYVDLEKLVPDEVDGMFDKLRSTKAIIFDMRGYPNGTAWPIAPRINTRNARDAASFSRHLVSPRGPDGATVQFLQPLPKDDRWRYTGRTVMLVDERTISQAEHTALFFEAAAGTKFVGSATAGANGDVTTMLLPGGLKLKFTGHDVRHADGRPLQRFGLVPDVPVVPTIAGIRAARDEVLERAVEYLSGR